MPPDLCFLKTLMIKEPWMNVYLYTHRHCEMIHLVICLPLILAISQVGFLPHQLLVIPERHLVATC